MILAVGSVDLSDNAEGVARVQTSDAVVRATLAFARSQIGKPFDDTALWSFFTDQAKSRSKRRCGEIQW